MSLCLGPLPLSLPVNCLFFEARLTVSGKPSLISSDPLSCCAVWGSPAACRAGSALPTVACPLRRPGWPAVGAQGSSRGFIFISLPTECLPPTRAAPGAGHRGDLGRCLRSGPFSSGTAWLLAMWQRLGLSWRVASAPPGPSQGAGCHL